MAHGIETTSDCDGLRSAHPDAEKLHRIAAGSVLQLLREDERDYYKVAYEGRPVFVPKSAGVRVEVSRQDLAPPTSEQIHPPLSGPPIQSWLLWFFAALALATGASYFGWVQAGNTLGYRLFLSIAAAIVTPIMTAYFLGAGFWFWLWRGDTRWRWVFFAGWLLGGCLLLAFLLLWVWGAWLDQHLKP